MKSLVPAILSALVTIFSAFTPQQALAASPEKPKEVRFAYLNGPRPWILGKVDKSFDKAFGTPVKWINFASGPSALQALAAGEIDIARCGSTPVTSALVKKVPLEVIAVSGVIDGSERLVARKSIASIKDLEGHAVAYPAGSTAHYALQAVFKVYGVDSSKVKQVNLKPAEQLAAWKRGDVQAAYVWGPFWNQMVAEDGHELLRTGQLQDKGYYIFNAYVVSKKFATEHPDLVVSFLSVFEDTVKRYKADPDGSAAIIAKELGQDAEAAKQTLAGLAFPSLKEQLQVSLLGNGKNTADSNIAKGLAATAQFLVELGELQKNSLPPSFAPGINTSFLEKAAAK
ncbi:MAG: ABC transporter substrate-binding protein [Desulfovibrio sp.]|jgi:taurine transport system substrate-binding protein|nr:ABC transporter substrate-binding protein [Desulfovibrio sp.]